MRPDSPGSYCQVRRTPSIYIWAFNKTKGASSVNLNDFSGIIITPVESSSILPPVPNDKDFGDKVNPNSLVLCRKEEFFK